MNNQLVSVIIPAFNLGRYEKQFWKSLDTVINQTYKNLEIIIVDDKSTDNTWQLLIEAKNKDSRIQIFKNTHQKGLGGVLNECLDHTTGDLVARMDCDDFIDLDKFELQVKFLQKNPEIVAVGTDLYTIDQDGKITGEKIHATDHKEITSEMYKLAPMAHATVMARGDAYRKFRYDETLKHGEDVALYFYFETKGNLGNIPEKKYYYWINQTSNNFKNIKRTLRYTLLARWRVYKNYNRKPRLKELFFNILQLGLLILPNLVIKFIYEKFRLQKDPMKIIRYAIVGVLTVLIDITSYALLVELGVNYLLADVLNTPIFLTFNYFGHKYITFKKQAKSGQEIFRYIGVFIFNQLEALLILWLMSFVFPGMPVAGKIAQVVIIPITNYFLLKLFVFVKE